MTMKLSKIQEKFIAAIYDKSNLEILPEIVSSDIPKEELVGIYRGNLVGNLVGALRLTFGGVLSFLKDEKFNKLANEFLFKNPSRSNNLDNYGEGFSDFLRQSESDFISDVAQIDWLKQKSYLAKNDETFDLETLKSIKPEDLFDLKFKLSASAFLFESDFNLLSSRCKKNKMKRKNYFLVFRSKMSGVFEVECLRIAPQEYQFLKGVIAKLTLYEIYEKYEVDIQNILQRFLSNGIIVSFYQ